MEDKMRTATPENLQRECQATCSNILRINNVFFPLRSDDIIMALSDKSQQHLIEHALFDSANRKMGKDQPTDTCSQLIETLVEASQLQPF